MPAAAALPSFTTVSVSKRRKNTKQSTAHQHCPNRLQNDLAPYPSTLEVRE